MDTKKILIVIAIVLGLVVVIASFSLMNSEYPSDEFKLPKDIPAFDDDLLPDMEEDVNEDMGEEMTEGVEGEEDVETGGEEEVEEE